MCSSRADKDSFGPGADIAGAGQAVDAQDPANEGLGKALAEYQENL